MPKCKHNDVAEEEDVQVLVTVRRQEQDRKTNFMNEASASGHDNRCGGCGDSEFKLESVPFVHADPVV